MKTTSENTAVENTTAEAELFDDDDLYLEDEQGNRIPDSTIIEKATQVQTVTFRAAGLDHKAEVRFDQIGFLTRRAPSVIAARILEKYGVAGASDEELEDEETLAKTQAANEEIETSREFL